MIRLVGHTLNLLKGLKRKYIYQLPAGARVEGPVRPWKPSKNPIYLLLWSLFDEDMGKMLNTDYDYLWVERWKVGAYPPLTNTNRRDEAFLFQGEFLEKNLSYIEE